MLPKTSKPSFFERLAAVFFWVGYGSIFFSLLLTPQLFSVHRHPVVAISMWAAWIVLAVLFLRRLDRGGREAAFAFLVLVLLPIWGCILNTLLAPCRVDACDTDFGFRPFAIPEVYAFIALHLVAALAYAISRRRPEALPSMPEALVFGALLLGIVADAIAAVQLLFLMPYLLALPITLPLLAPGLSVYLFARELRARLSRRGAQVASHAHFERGIVAGMLLFGLYALAHGLVYGSPFSFARVVTHTCGTPLSLGTPEILHQKGCHYLCTVAARGHARLVKPERYGIRGGERIVVNRQLCVANAFEDLLHTRWPRFARVARQTYDFCGLPVSRWIRTPLAADVTYLVMKPFEWGFYVALLLLDPEDPEKRIDRMYR